MRIVFVSTVGGTHRAFLKGQVDFLQKKGFEIHLIANPDEALTECGTWPGVTVWGVSMSRQIRPLQDLLAVFHLIILFQKIRPDIANLSTPKAAFLGSIAACFYKKAISIFFVRGSLTASQRGWSTMLNKQVERLTACLCDEVVCVSHSLLNFLRQQGVIPKHRGQVIGNGMSNGINTNRFCKSKKEALRNLRQEPVVGFVGRITKEKGIDSLISAWKQLRLTFPTIKLLLVGRWDNDSPVTDATKTELLRNADITITGFTRDVVPYYEQMDVFVFPSLREGFPNAPMEASSMELPIVATRAIGTNDAIIDGLTGTLVDPNSPRDLATAITRYLENSPLGKKHGEAGRERVVKNFSQDFVWQAFCKFYRDIFNTKIKADSIYCKKRQAA